MGKKKPIPNLHCPVPGCKTKAPHASDPAVSAFIKIFADPVRLTAFARTGMSQLLISMEQDWKGQRQFAWFCRIRQTEELFYKALYELSSPIKQVLINAEHKDFVRQRHSPILCGHRWNMRCSQFGKTRR